MRKNGRYILFVFLLSLVFAGCVLGADNRILLVGDSITEGVKSSDSLGFRDALYEKLLEEGYPFCFVGYPGEPPYRGHFRAGALIEQFYSGPGGDSTFSVVWDMKLDKPHIAVIHLGTNDIYSLNPVTPYTKDGGLSFTEGTIAGRLANLILYMLKWHNGEMGDHLRYILSVDRIVARSSVAYKSVGKHCSVGKSYTAVFEDEGIPLARGAYCPCHFGGSRS